MAKRLSPLVIDGSVAEGGGVLFRTLIGLSSLTQQPVRIHSIRGATKFPGLNSEDLVLLKALRHCVDAEVSGAELGASEIVFAPTRRPRALNDTLRPFAENNGFANALVVLNALIPIVARAGAYSDIRAEGETYGHNILSFDYFAGVTLPTLARFGLYAEARLERAGFGRYGRGSVLLGVEPSATQGVEWTDRGELKECRAIVAVAKVADSVGTRGCAHLEKLGRGMGFELSAEKMEVESAEPGAFVTVWAEFERGFGGATAMGIRGVRVEAIAQQAFDGFRQWFESDATVDAHLADQILMTAVAAEGDTTLVVDRLTPRLSTMAWAIKQFLPIRLTVKGDEGGRAVVSVRR